MIKTLLNGSALLALLPLGLALAGRPALAHGIETTYLLDEQLELQSRFSTGQPFKGAKVSIYAPNNPTQPWRQGVTDDQGRFAFTPDTAIPGHWEVTIIQQGHGDILTVPVGANGVSVDLISDAGGYDNHWAIATGVGTTLAGLVTLGIVRQRRLG